MTIVREKKLAETWDKTQARQANELVRDLVQVLNGGIVIGDQFPGLKRHVRWNTTDAPVKVGPFLRPVQWVMCLGARLVSAPSSVVSGCAVSWSYQGQNVVIASIEGLSSGVAYDVDLLCLEA
jgi:hypothetical protein